MPTVELVGHPQAQLGGRTDQLGAEVADCHVVVRDEAGVVDRIRPGRDGQLGELDLVDLVKGRDFSLVRGVFTGVGAGPVLDRTTSWMGSVICLWG